MAYQLLFTSVPAGLKPGTSGYTTAAHTQGMPDELIAALEAVSGYDHLATRDPSFGGPNPSIYRYQILQLNAGTFFVLSILQDSGADHTGRTNYLAQHLVIESYELNVLQQSPEINPASILLVNPDSQLWYPPGPVTAQYLQPLEINTLIQQLKAKGAERSIPKGADFWRQCTRAQQAPALLEGGLQAKCCLSCPPESEKHLLNLFAETLRIAIEKPNESTGQPRSPQEAWRYTFNVFVQAGESHQDYVWCGLCGPALQEAAGQQFYDIFGGGLPDATDERLLSFAETGGEPYVPPPVSVEPEVPQQAQLVTPPTRRTPAAPSQGMPGTPSGTPGGIPNRQIAGARKTWRPGVAGSKAGGAAMAQMGTAAEAAKFQAEMNANVLNENVKKARRKKVLMAACIILIPMLVLAGLFYGGVIGGGNNGGGQPGGGQPGGGQPGGGQPGGGQPGGGNTLPVERMSCPVERMSCPVERMSCPVERMSCPVERMSCPVERMSCPVVVVTARTPAC